MDFGKGGWGIICSQAFIKVADLESIGEMQNTSCVVPRSSISLFRCGETLIYALATEAVDYKDHKLHAKIVKVAMLC